MQRDNYQAIKGYFDHKQKKKTNKHGIVTNYQKSQLIYLNKK